MPRGNPARIATTGEFGGAADTANKSCPSGIKVPPKRMIGSVDSAESPVVELLSLFIRLLIFGSAKTVRTLPRPIDRNGRPVRMLG
tara:strand:- start:3450 stop:3707 length:258 start_codon:yes stop_codon:yes gene_type:complete